MIAGLLVFFFFIAALMIPFMIPVAIIILFFPDNHPWVIWLDKFSGYSDLNKSQKSKKP